MWVGRKTTDDGSRSGGVRFLDSPEHDSVILKGPKGSGVPRSPTLSLFRERDGYGRRRVLSRTVQGPSDHTPVSGGTGRPGSTSTPGGPSVTTTSGGPCPPDTRRGPARRTCVPRGRPRGAPTRPCRVTGRGTAPGPPTPLVPATRRGVVTVTAVTVGPTTTGPTPSRTRGRDGGPGRRGRHTRTASPVTTYHTVRDGGVGPAGGTGAVDPRPLTTSPCRSLRPPDPVRAVGSSTTAGHRTTVHTVPPTPTPGPPPRPSRAEVTPGCPS